MLFPGRRGASKKAKEKARKGYERENFFYFSQIGLLDNWSVNLFISQETAAVVLFGFGQRAHDTIVPKLRQK